MNDIEYSIIPFDKQFQSSIDKMMHGIAKEFLDPITPKDSDPKPVDPDVYWLAINNGEVIGTIGVITIDNRYGILKRMMVAKDHRGKNLSEELLNLAFNWCKKNNIPRIYLGTMTQFKAAQKFYRKNNFTEISREELPKYFINNSLDSVFFMKEIL